TTTSTVKMAPNLASLANGAIVVSADGDGAKNLGDDTEASSWSVRKGGQAVVKLAKAATISSVQVSAFTTSRFEGLKSFTVQVSDDGINWRTALSKENGFGYEAPRPTVGDVHYRTFKLDNPVKASYVRFFADAPLGNTKTTIQVGDLQVFSDAVSGINPTPPPPPDEPVTETFTIDAGNPTGDVTQGVTGTELTASCVSPPASQGVDGWVSDVPEGFDDGVHTVTAAGDSVAPYDLDIYFYNSRCELIGDAASASADESGVIPSGAKYVLTQLWLGVSVPVTLTMKDTA
ncbi:MAG: discoidin domain-containing protein, partial [Propionibacteriales bacterium]|nr:discoidin domain-containing protein [Propionibacteriales bacterium]